MFRFGLAITTSALLLAGCATVPVADHVSAAPPAMAATPLAADTPSQLPRTAAPSHYAIQITPDAKNLTFAAQSAVDLSVFEPTDTIVLNARDLNITEARLVKEGAQDAVPVSISLDKASQTVTFTADRKIEPGNYTLSTTYTGTINTQANGLFALDYPDKRDGSKKRALFTQFEAPDARRFVPSFDEPSYKATFDLSAIVPSGLMAVSNMPIATSDDLGDGTKKVTFDTSPKMSSYLLFFGLGDFERGTMPAMPGVEAGIVAPAGSGSQKDFALKSLAPLIPFYSDYFGQKYPLPKIDNIAGPGQSQFFGAMENWGAVFTFERILLDDPRITSAGTRRRIYETQAHEVAHQWFGDLVTMAWWDDLWLNEGFASWMETKATNHFHPEWYPMLGRVGGREAAMGLDSFKTTHPIVQKIRTVEQTNQAFDTITYQKGEAVISMLEAYATPQVWQKGLQRYMAEHKYANARTGQLWAAVEEAGATGLTGIAEDFTTKPGVPLVEVTGETCTDGKTTLALSQSQFSNDDRQGVAASPQGWRIPLFVSTVGGEPVRQVMDGKTATVTVDGCGATLVNAGQLGYYRTLYPAAMLATLKDAVPQMKPIDQLGLMRDQLALSSAGYQAFAPSLDLLRALPGDANPVVAANAVGIYAGMYETLDGDAAAQAKIAGLASSQFGARLQQLGFSPIAGEPLVDDSLRSTLISNLGAMGDQKVASEASRLFAELQTDPTALDGPLKTTWLSIIAKNASADQWEQILKLARTSNSAVEKATYYSLLGRAKDKVLAQKALDLALTSEPGATTSAGIIASVAGENPDMAVDFFLANQEKIKPLVDDSARARYFARLASGSKDPAMIGKLESYVKTVTPDQAKPLVMVIGFLKQAAISRPRSIASIKEWLATQ
ncbi:M1 family metallopeptidase [Tsuneonella mangrovi]|uniref:M1 family metallopeptidase n=1 Tax=Tsuneonella mangrovi TaxID=1982042 RepID=UPI001F0B611C|nr:M1 family metallopeptidase [Tsuneonella mangrovi]